MHAYSAVQHVPLSFIFPESYKSKDLTMFDLTPFIRHTRDGIMFLHLEDTVIFLSFWNDSSYCYSMPQPLLTVCSQFSWQKHVLYCIPQDDFLRAKLHKFWHVDNSSSGSLNFEVSFAVNSLAIPLFL